MNKKIFQASSDVIVIVNQDGIIVDVNDSIQAVFGYNYDEVVGKDLTILLPDRFRADHGHHFQSFVQKPVARRMGDGRQLFAQKKNGQEFHVDVGLSSYEERGERFFVAMVRDISHLKEIEEKLIEQNKELTAKNRELDQFARIISHDLKAPANTVIQFVNLINLDHKEELSEEVKGYFAQIMKGAYNMCGLIDGILRYSVAASENEVLSEFSWHELMEDVFSIVTIPDKLKVIVSPENHLIQGKKVHLLQVLSNLVTNAVKYHNKPQGTIKIEIKDHSKDHFMFSVSDDGPGIAEKHHQTIFEMFGTAHGTRRVDSTGIGLAIVKKLIQDNGGEISLDSREGKGCKFEFTWRKKPSAQLELIVQDKDYLGGNSG